MCGGRHRAWPFAPMKSRQWNRRISRPGDDIGVTVEEGPALEVNLTLTNVIVFLRRETLSNNSAALK